ncbi:MAG: UbiD family decarboxylase [Bacteroidetes bacterium]|nr:UbiD family decarboxylase [Bacteroidota bacterium]
MSYASLRACVEDLERHGHLIRIREEVDPYLEMAAIHLRVHEAGGPALLFENVKGSAFPAVSNLFGTIERSRFMFRHSLDAVQKLVALRSDPMQALRKPLQHLGVPFTALKALPRKARLSVPVAEMQTQISKLPQIHHWPMDGGPFVTLPIVYTEDIDRPGVMRSNIGMYRIQLGGNEYVQDKEIGLHYQLHRGIGVHQTKANAKGQPLKVSIFVGGPPALTFGAVMPLPEGLSELTFAGVLGGRRFRYAYRDGFCLAADADFVITGEVYPGENKPEGPFGDHLGYYSLKHDFPLMRVHKVYHRRDAIWPFTVVGRPPQEDTSFGALVHELTGNAIPDEIPGLKAVHAVDAAGVHPLLLAIGSERYTPYLPTRRPAEIITQANAILGFGQLSLAKYLFICAGEDNPQLNIHHVVPYFTHLLSRIDYTRDLHFHTQTSIDTLDYSGTGLNTGSKVVFAAAGNPVRELCTEAPALQLPTGFEGCGLAIPGVLTVQGPKFSTYENATRELAVLTDALSTQPLEKAAMIVLCDDARFTAATVNNWLWVTFTRSNPSHDIYGVNAFTEHKHWGCHGPVVIDARIKPHHAPPVEKDAAVEKRIDRLFVKGGPLHGKIK